MKNPFVRYSTGWHYAPPHLHWLAFGAFTLYRPARDEIPPAAVPPRFVQERFDPGQRAARKRRAFIQRLNRR